MDKVTIWGFTIFIFLQTSSGRGLSDEGYICHGPVCYPPNYDRKAVPENATIYMNMYHAKDELKRVNDMDMTITLEPRIFTLWQDHRIRLQNNDSIGLDWKALKVLCH